MRFALSLLLLLSACGDDSSGGGSGSAPVFDVTRATVVPSLCTIGAGAVCAADVQAECTGGKPCVKDGQLLATSFAFGAVAPEACVANAVTSVATSVFVTGLPPATLFSFRVCMFDKAANTYTPGATASFTTPG